MQVVAAITVVVMFAVGAGMFAKARGTAATAAQKVCKRLTLSGLTVTEGQRILDKAIESGVSASDLESECADRVAALRNGALRNLVRAEIGTCDPHMIDGTVVNNNDRSVDVTLHYELLSPDGSRVDDGLVLIEAVKPGQTLDWNSSVNAKYRSCRIAIESVQPAA